MRHIRLCQHTKDDGKLCGSPAMRGKSYCYFHLDVVLRRRRLARMARERQLLAEAKRFDDRILGLNSYAVSILGHYTCVTSLPSEICRPEGEGGEPVKAAVCAERGPNR